MASVPDASSLQVPRRRRCETQRNRDGPELRRASRRHTHRNRWIHHITCPSLGLDASAPADRTVANALGVCKGVYARFGRLGPHVKKFTFDRGYATRTAPAAAFELRSRRSGIGASCPARERDRDGDDAPSPAA